MDLCFQIQDIKNNLIYYRVTKPEITLFNCVKAHCEKEGSNINKIHLYYNDLEVDINTFNLFTIENNTTFTTKYY